MLWRRWLGTYHAASRGYRLGFEPRLFPAISVTGNWCGLNCPYCRGRYLAGMRWSLTPEELEAKLAEAASKGAIGVLISGGWTREGKLPLTKRHLNVIERYSGRLAVHIHAGVLEVEEAAELKYAGVRMVDHFLPTHTWGRLVSRRVAEALWSTLESLERSHLDYAPHLLLIPSADWWEYREAVERLTSYKPRLVVVLGLLSGADAKLAARLAALIESRLGVEAALGCMRPRNREWRAVEQAFSRVAVPSRRGGSDTTLPCCCSVVDEVLHDCLRLAE